MLGRTVAGTSGSRVPAGSDVAAGSDIAGSDIAAGSDAWCVTSFIQPLGFMRRTSVDACSCAFVPTSRACGQLLIGGLRPEGCRQPEWRSPEHLFPLVVIVRPASQLEIVDGVGSTVRPRNPVVVFEQSHLITQFSFDPDELAASLVPTPDGPAHGGRDWRPG